MSNANEGAYKYLVDMWESYEGIFNTTTALAEFNDGQVEKYLLKVLKEQMSEQSFKAAKARIAPVNLLKKVVDKLSPVYAPGPRRIIEGDNKTDSDQELLDWYVNKMNADKNFMYAVQMAVLAKSSGIQPYLDSDGCPQMRVLLKDRFFPVSNNDFNPLKMTGVVTFTTNSEGKTHFRYVTKYYWVEFNEAGEPVLFSKPILNEAGEVIDEVLTEIVDNDYEAIDFVYLNLSRLKLFSPPEDDMVRMPLIIPVLLTDLNYFSMYQVFSIIYTMNVEDIKPIMAPNAVWRLHGDQSSPHQPRIEILKPDADIEGLLTVIQSQIALWLNSKGIRPGSVGTLDKDSFASGISKMIDEMDTFELRKELVGHAQGMEKDFWNLIINNLHPAWAESGLLLDDDGKPETRKFSPGVRVVVNFAEQVPLSNRGQVVDTLEKEVKAGFTTRKRAIMTLNPNMTDTEVESLIDEIDEEKSTNAQVKGEFIKENDDEPNPNDP